VLFSAAGWFPVNPAPNDMKRSGNELQQQKAEATIFSLCCQSHGSGAMMNKKSISVAIPEDDHDSFEDDMEVQAQ
jgi:hypothetical protein